MPDRGLEVDSQSLRRLLGKFQKLGGDVEGTMMNVVDRGSEIVLNHMKGQHFFVGTGKGSSRKAVDNEFTFVNPDGTPRFKTRTANLLNSMQSRGALKTSRGIRGKVTVSMKYARDIDEGGPGRRAFPFRIPAIVAAGPLVRKDAVKVVQVAIRRFGGRG